MRHLLRTAIPMLLAVVAGGLMLVFVLREVAPHSWNGTAFAAPDPAPAFTGLSFDSGEPADLTRYEGKVVVVFFGYTSCPDVCPTTMTDIQRAIGRLDAGDADRVSLAMATIDPDRDTADVLTGYVRSFVPDGHALVTTDDTRLRAVADAFGASYGSELDDAGEPEVFHTGFLYAVDDEGRLAITWPFGVTTDDYEHDLRLLLDRA